MSRLPGRAEFRWRALNRTPVRIIALIAMVCLSVSGASLAQAGQTSAPSFMGSLITVNTTVDAIDAAGDCSLREAIMAANLNAVMDACPAGSGSQIDYIVIPPGFYQLSLAGAENNVYPNMQVGDLDILDEVFIEGAGQDATIVDGGDIDRVFHIAAAVQVVIQHLTIQNGMTMDENAGGGGVMNWGSLTLREVTIRDNYAFLVGGGLLNWSRILAPEALVSISALPGLPYPLESSERKSASSRQSFLMDNFTASLVSSEFITATAIVVDSFLTNNEAGDGGGVFNTLTGEVYLYDSTLSANNAYTETGGALDNAGYGAVWNVTISGNEAAQGGGGIFNDGTLAVHSSTIVSNSSDSSNAGGNVSALNSTQFSYTLVANSQAGPNCSESEAGDDIVSLGYNLDSGSSCKFTQPGDIHGTGVLAIGPLDDNGGPTLTHALLPGSPAIDVAAGLNCVRLDQRGAMRPTNGGGDPAAYCDIGAYEYDSLFPEELFIPIILR